MKNGVQKYRASGHITAIDKENKRVCIKIMDEFHIHSSIYADYTFPISEIRGKGKVEEGRFVDVDYKMRSKKHHYELLGICSCRFSD